MRSILGITMLLLGAGLLSCRIERRPADVSNPAAAVDWVRTVDGWEQSPDWCPSLAAPPAVHPLVVAAAQVLVSVFALVAAGGPVDRPKPGR